MRHIPVGWDAITQGQSARRDPPDAMAELTSQLKVVHYDSTPVVTK